MGLNRYASLGVLFAMLLLVAGCGNSDNGSGDEDGSGNGDEQLYVISTTTWLHDAVSRIGGDHVEAESLMGPGIDPHAYVASEGDVTRMERADIIFFNGHFLEGAMSDVLNQIGQQRRTLAVAEQLDEDLLLEPDHDLLGEDYDAPYDPHVWFDVELWKLVSEAVRDEFIEVDPDNEDAYRANADDYIAELDELSDYINDRIEEVPENQRVLITAHDAFGYLGAAFDLEVMGLQPITTSVEAAASDIRELSDLIVEREIRAIFLESAVPPQGIEAVQAAVQDRGFDVRIASDPLYGDALGEPDSDGGTYVGAYRFNIDTIVDALTAD